MENVEVKKPEDYLTVTVNGSSQEIFMSGGLVRRLTSIAGALMDVGEIFGRPDLQGVLIVEALRPRTKRGQEDGDYTIEDFDMNIEDTDRLVAWMVEHILYFFIKNTLASKKLEEAHRPAMEHLLKLAEEAATEAQKATQTPSSSGTSA